MKSVALSAILLMGCSNGEQTVIEQPPNVDTTVAAVVAATRTARDVQQKVAATMSAPTLRPQHRRPLQ
jgi:PBP1b-binding outer membrane lipoprotein LpoB